MSKELSVEKSGAQLMSILARHLSVLASAQNVTEFMPPFWNELETFVVQTIIDGSLPRGYVSDFTCFCDNVGSFVTEVHSKLKSDKESSKFYYNMVDLAKRIIMAAFGSSLVYKGTNNTNKMSIPVYIYKKYL